MACCLMDITWTNVDLDTNLQIVSKIYTFQSTATSPREQRIKWVFFPQKGRISHLDITRPYEEQAEQTGGWM